MKEIKQLNIAHVVYSFDYGGLERRILRLIDGLSPMGVRFHVISLRHSEGKFLNSKYPIEHHVLNARPGVDLGATFRLARYLRYKNVHIVHSHNWVSMLEGISSARIARAPVAVHGEHGASRFEPNQLRWRRTVTQRLLAMMADQIVPVNSAIADRIIDLWALKSSSITTIPNGVDLGRFSPKKRPADGKIVIGSISRIEPIKNFPCLIRATAMLNQQAGRVKYHLIIVGAGSETDALLRLVEEINAGDFVELPGATDCPEDWYSSFDIYVNCSFSEGMSNTVLEAMACGLPIVASNVAGHREWLEENTNAVFFSSNDVKALASALESLDFSARLSMGETNRILVTKSYDERFFIGDYVAMYDRLLTNKGISFPFPDSTIHRTAN